MGGQERIVFVSFGKPSPVRAGLLAFRPGTLHEQACSACVSTDEPSLCNPCPAKHTSVKFRAVVFHHTPWPGRDAGVPGCGACSPLLATSTLAASLFSATRHAPPWCSAGLTHQMRRSPSDATSNGSSPWGTRCRHHAWLAAMPCAHPAHAVVATYVRCHLAAGRDARARQSACLPGATARVRDGHAGNGAGRLGRRGGSLVTLH